MKIPYKFYSKKEYWQIKSTIERLRFNLRNQRFRVKNFYNDQKAKTRSTYGYIAMTIWSSIKALSFIAVLFIIEGTATDLWQKNYSSIPFWLIKFQSLIPKPVYPDNRDAIVELISVIASVSGVILALFYPILATIASTAYAKVHASIRNLLLYEKETQGYLRRLTYLTAYSITVLLFLSFDYRPGNLILCFLAIYSFTTLFGILKIGFGVYNFFEPSTLLGIVISKTSEVIDSVTTDGQYWYDRNFQSYNYKLALEQTENLALIMTLCTKDDDLKESSFKSTARSSFLLLKYYFINKKKIPVDSMWFPNIYNHLSYFESDQNLRQLSKSTNTFVQPKVIQNYYWFEEKIVSHISLNLNLVVKSGYINLLSEVILISHSLFDSLGSLTDLKTGEKMLSGLLQNMKALTEKATAQTPIINYVDWKHELASIETYSYAVLRLQIGVFEKITSYNSEKIISEYKKIDWDKKDSVYLTDFLSDVHQRMHKIFDLISNERFVEGKRVTPDWYFQQDLTSVLLRDFSSKVPDTVKLFEKYLAPLLQHFGEQNNPLLASYGAHIGIEIIHKLQYRLKSLVETMDDIDQLETCKKEFVWLKPDFKEIDALLLKYEQDLLVVIARDIEKLALIKWNNQYPDVFGHSYSMLSKHINHSFWKNDINQIEKHFPPFLNAAMAAFNMLNEAFKHYQQPGHISHQTLVDVMQISGYAYIYSAVYEDPKYWEAIKIAWEKNFEPSENNMKILITSYNYYRTNLNGIGINYNEEFQRQKALQDIIQKRKITADSIEDYMVKPFIGDMFHRTFENTAELFIEVYLFSFIEAKPLIELLKGRNLYKRLRYL